jgi:hypothetical protein
MTQPRRRGIIFTPLNASTDVRAKRPAPKAFDRIVFLATEVLAKSKQGNLEELAHVRLLAQGRQLRGWMSAFGGKADIAQAIRGVLN